MLRFRKGGYLAIVALVAVAASGCIEEVGGPTPLAATISEHVLVASGSVLTASTPYQAREQVIINQTGSTNANVAFADDIQEFAAQNAWHYIGTIHSFNRNTGAPGAPSVYAQYWPFISPAPKGEYRLLLHPTSCVFTNSASPCTITTGIGATYPFLIV